jgi:hypothetical protein
LPFGGWLQVFFFSLTTEKRSEEEKKDKKTNKLKNNVTQDETINVLCGGHSGRVAAVDLIRPQGRGIVLILQVDLFGVQVKVTQYALGVSQHRLRKNKTNSG